MENKVLDMYFIEKKKQIEIANELNIQDIKKKKNIEKSLIKRNI